MSLVLKISPDSDPENPRLNDNITGMWCAHRRYSLGDKDYPNRAVTAEEVAAQHGPLALIKPLYMYDHGGITIRTSPFSCPWDSGQIGWVFITKKKAKEEFSPSKSFPTVAVWADAQLEIEVTTYDQFLTGDVWCFTILDESGEVLDSLSGLFGHEYAEQEGNAALLFAETERKAVPAAASA